MLSRIVGWASDRDDIRTVILTGSRARNDGRVDEDSDYDVELFTTDLRLYETDTAWMAEIGRVWVYLALELPTDARYRMRLVVFDGGHKVDFGFAPTVVLDEMVARRSVSDIYNRGYRVLLDKDGRAAALPRATGTSPARALPTEAEFRAAVAEFWFEAFHIPKLIDRNDLWVVKMRDWTMKRLLLEMIEWHAVAGRGPTHDVWHIGTRLEEWAAGDVWVRLHDVFGLFGKRHAWRALIATTSLFRDVSKETATLLGLAYPESVDTAITGYIDDRFERASVESGIAAEPSAISTGRPSGDSPPGPTSRGGRA
jgi:aminoglycoside 6-adenylyltransferase